MCNNKNSLNEEYLKHHELLLLRIQQIKALIEIINKCVYSLSSDCFNDTSQHLLIRLSQRGSTFIYSLKNTHMHLYITIKYV